MVEWGRTSFKWTTSLGNSCDVLINSFESKDEKLHPTCSSPYTRQKPGNGIMNVRGRLQCRSPDRLQYTGSGPGMAYLMQILFYKAMLKLVDIALKRERQCCPGLEDSAKVRPWTY